MSRPNIRDLKEQEAFEKLKRIIDKQKKGEIATEEIREQFTEEEWEYIISPPLKPPVKKTGSGCMVTLLIIIAPTILLSLLIF